MTREEAISRQSVIEQIDNWSKDELLRVTNPFDYLHKRINSLPSVIPQPKTGHWIAEFVTRTQPDNWDKIAIKCSECGVVKTRIMYNADTMDFDETVRDYTNTLKKNHYCFNCGAKMVES